MDVRQIEVGARTGASRPLESEPSLTQHELVKGAWQSEVVYAALQSQPRRRK